MVATGRGADLVSVSTVTDKRKLLALQRPNQREEE
jgi:hypothetical protein